MEPIEQTGAAEGRQAGLAVPGMSSSRGSADIADGIITPEAVVLEVETAGLASRVAAALIDLVLISAVIGIMTIVLALVLDESTGATATGIVFFAGLFGYPILFESLMDGRTPGKAALGLRVVSVTGAPVRWPEVVLRAMGGVVDKLAPPGGITGALFVMWTPRHQRIGDLLAGTIVINDPALHRSAPALWFSAPPGMADYAEQIDPTPMTPEQYTVIRTFLTRAASLSPETRRDVATRLSDELAALLRCSRPGYMTNEDFLLCVMARYQRRTGASVR